MPIDSAPDEPDRAREIPAAPNRHRHVAPDGHGTAASRQRQIDAHLESRNRVAAAEQAYKARQAWEQAVPQLQVAWENHKNTYPERSVAKPDTQPDGGWVADDGRVLSPEQNAEATKACADLRDEANQVILPAMQRVEAASPDGRLAGLQHMLKGEARLKEKLAAAVEVPGVLVTEAIALVPDAVRYTLTYGSDRYVEGVLADVGRLKAEGFELVKLKNLWHADQYKGVNSQWLRPDTGLRFEMQFHTPESLEAKELTHEAYERIRSQGISATEKVELEGFQRNVNALIATPPGIDQIKDFPELRR